jgi:hypothetical protein
MPLMFLKKHWTLTIFYKPIMKLIFNSPILVSYKSFLNLHTKQIIVKSIYLIQHVVSFNLTGFKDAKKKSVLSSIIPDTIK